MNNVKVLVTGSSGYVGADLMPRIKSKQVAFGVDISPSEYTDIEASINSQEFQLFSEELECDQLTIINLAAARFDFGATAGDYYRLNVECHEMFLKSLSKLRVTKFIHVSSVAAFDGRDIPYTEMLNCDDAYRSTKYLQELLVEKWCDERSVEFTVLYPSAIFSKDRRSDTNIGKMQSIAKILPFVPLIGVFKSLTYLSNFSDFIVDLSLGKLPPGKYLTIENPTLTVTNMVQILSGRRLKVLHIPWLRPLLKITANLLYLLGGLGKLDLKLTPNRVVKLFSDTSYNNLTYTETDLDTYAVHNKENLTDILKGFNGKL